MRPLVRSLLARASGAGALALVGLALVGLLPRLAAAQATAEGKACVALVDEFAGTCSDYAWYMEAPCLWLAGVGYMACVLVDLIVLLGKSVGLPSPI